MADSINYYVREQINHFSQKGKSGESRTEKAHGRITPTLKAEVLEAVENYGYKSLSEFINESLTAHLASIRKNEQAHECPLKPAGNAEDYPHEAYEGAK